jgi:hypothetical protein
VPQQQQQAKQLRVPVLLHTQPHVQ